MTTDTPGATIFYTSSTQQFVNPTHNGGTPTGNTMIYTSPVAVPAHSARYISAVAYENGFLDSNVSQAYEDNLGPVINPLDSPLLNGLSSDPTTSQTSSNASAGSSTPSCPDMTGSNVLFQYCYDAASNVTRRYSYTNAVAQVYVPDNVHRIQERDVVNASGTISSDVYGYDGMNRLTSVDRETGKRDSFGYDYSGQLTSAQYGLVNNANPSRNVGYNWDDAGNRNSISDTGNTTTYHPNNINQYDTSDGVSNGAVHEIASYGGLSYAYIGDTYLAKVTGNGNTYTLYYDALGRCIKRTLNNTTTYYIHDGEKPIQEYKSNGSRAGYNVYGKGIDEILLRADYVIVPGGQGYFYQQDRNGNVTHLTGFSGEVLEKYSYDAFGAPTTTFTSGSYNNRFKFTGREYQSTFAFYEYRARAYHPGLGRFMSEDPKGFDAGDYNLFRYCSNDPLDKSDPMGLETLTSAQTDEQVGNRVVEVSQFIGHQVAEMYREDPIGFILMAATMGRAPEGRGAAPRLRVEPLQPRLMIEGRPVNPHAAYRMSQDHITSEGMSDALRKPLKVTQTEYNERGQPSQQYIGRTTTVVVNPKTGEVVTVWRTGSTDARKLVQQQQPSPAPQKEGR
jgi:RHS repeat-associated protein